LQTSHMCPLCRYHMPCEYLWTWSSAPTIIQISSLFFLNFSKVDIFGKFVYIYLRTRQLYACTPSGLLQISRYSIRDWRS
jgi:hypothetical protein